MPTLPEIEVIRRDLEKEIVGRRFKEVDVRSNKHAMKIIKRHGRRKDLQDLLVGAKVESIDRSGRWIILELDNAHFMVIDLGGTGRLLKTSTSDGMETHTHIVLSFTIGGQLRLVDKQHSSELFVVPTAEFETMREEQTILIDPLIHPVAWQRFSQLLSDREVRMKDLLLDDEFIVGLGDIYSDEVLFGAGLRHDRMSSKLSSQDVRRLYRALMEILQDSLKVRGTSYGDDPFVDLHGDPGQYQLELKVYEREGEACRRCRSEVVREEVNGYVSYFCPQCQS